MKDCRSTPPCTRLRMIIDDILDKFNGNSTNGGSTSFISSRALMAEESCPSVVIGSGGVTNHCNSLGEEPLVKPEWLPYLLVNFIHSKTISGATFFSSNHSFPSAIGKVACIFIKSADSKT